MSREETERKIGLLCNEIFALSNSMSKSDGERYSLFPIPKEEEEEYKFYKKQDSLTWFVEELHLKEDYDDFQALEPELKTLIKRVFAFFNNGDGVIGDILAFRMLVESRSKCERNFYIAQMQIEKIHEETYTLYVDLMISDEKEKRDLFFACDNYPAVQRKIKWLYGREVMGSHTISRQKKYYCYTYKLYLGTLYLVELIFEYH